MKKIALLLSLFTLSSYAQDTVNNRKTNFEFDFGLGLANVKTEKNFPLYGQSIGFNFLAEYPLNKNGNIGFGFVYGLNLEGITFNPSSKIANQSTFVGIPLKVRFRSKKTNSSGLFADIGLIGSALVDSKTYIEDKKYSENFNSFNLGLTTALGFKINQHFYTKLQSSISFTPTTINKGKYYFSSVLINCGYKF